MVAVKSLSSPLEIVLTQIHLEAHEFLCSAPRRPDILVLVTVYIRRH